MYKELDDLERAIGRLVEKAGQKKPERSFPGVAGSRPDEGGTGKQAGRSEPVNEEAADLIRRALKRLRSL